MKGSYNRSRIIRTYAITDRRQMLLSKVVVRTKMARPNRLTICVNHALCIVAARYYVHIVCDNESLKRIRQDIIDNRAQW
jgi:hypothetical protein